MTQISPELIPEKADNTSAISSARIRNIFKRASGIYTVIAIMSMNTIIALIVANVVCYVVMQGWQKQEEQQKDKVHLALFTEKYHDYTVPQCIELMKENRRQHQFELAPYIGYKFRPDWRKYLHITPAGFRCSTDNGPWPPSPKNLNVFVYGASTTFGPGITDDETIPAQLQSFLKDKGDKPVKVYNFGTSGYNSTTERVQFANMLAQGVRPDVAVFIDGNMDAQFYTDEPPLTNEMRVLMKDRGYGLLKASMPFFHDLPMTKLSDKLRGTLSSRKGHSNRVRFNEAQADHIIARYSANKHLIEVQAQAYGVKTLFVWQPCSSYKFDRKYHPFPEDISHADMVPTYERMAQTTKNSTADFKRDFLWLADMQEGITEPCYVDDNHYRANLCKLIATKIGEALRSRDLLAKNMTPPVESPKE